jgi:hypothetical protein
MSGSPASANSHSFSLHGCIRTASWFPASCTQGDFLVLVSGCRSCGWAWLGEARQARSARDEANRTKPCLALSRGSRSAYTCAFRCTSHKAPGPGSRGRARANNLCSSAVAVVDVHTQPPPTRVRARWRGAAPRPEKGRVEYSTTMRVGRPPDTARTRRGRGLFTCVARSRDVRFGKSGKPIAAGVRVACPPITLCGGYYE